MGNHMTRALAYQQRTLRAAMEAAGPELGAGLPREAAVRIVAALHATGHEVAPFTPEAIGAYQQAKWTDHAAATKPIHEDVAELRAYAEAGPAVSRATCGRIADEVERLRSHNHEMAEALKASAKPIDIYATILQRAIDAEAEVERLQASSQAGD